MRSHWGGNHLVNLHECFSICSFSAVDRRMVLGHFSDIIRDLKVGVPFDSSAECSKSSIAPQHANCPQVGVIPVLLNPQSMPGVES